MNCRLYIGVIRVFILFFLISAGARVSVAQQDVNNDQGQPAMSPAPASGGDLAGQATPSSKDPIVLLRLNRFEAVVGDPSLCANDKSCMSFVKNIKTWRCAADACGGTDKSKRIVDCFEGAGGKYSAENQAKIAPLICKEISSPSAENRKALLSYIPYRDEEDLIGIVAMVLALKGSAQSCEQYIKSYVGAYGAQWDPQRYATLSGCRILAHETTRDLEEKNFLKWFGVVHGSGSCSDIFIHEMRDACKAPSAASPVPL